MARPFPSLKSAQQETRHRAAPHAVSSAWRIAVVSSVLRAALSSGWVMHAPKGRFKLFLEVSERPGERGAARNQHIIVAGEGVRGGRGTNERAQPAANAVAVDGLADLLGDGETEPRRSFRVALARSRFSFEYEARSGPPRAAPQPQELRALLEGRRFDGCRNRLRRTHRTSRGQALPALGAPPRQDLHSARGQRPLAKAVAPLAHEPAWLISAFHVRSPLARTPNTALATTSIGGVDTGVKAAGRNGPRL